jgi:invasion protein IalB
MAGSMNALRYMLGLPVLALALGTSLAVGQEGEAVSKTTVPKVAPAARAAAPAAPPAGAPAAGAEEGLEETAWVKVCRKNEQTSKQICLVQHQRLDPNTGIVPASIAVRTVEGQDKHSLLVGVTTAYSLVIPAGVQIKIDGDEPISRQYAVCLPMSCQAQMELTEEIFDKMRKGKQMIVTALNMQQKSIGFPVPLTGFGEAFDGPPVDNVKYEEARQRQIALANKIAAQHKEQGTRQSEAGAPPKAGDGVPQP